MFTTIPLLTPPAVLLQPPTPPPPMAPSSPLRALIPDRLSPLSIPRHSIPRKPAPTLQIRDHLGVAEVLDHYAGARNSHSIVEVGSEDHDSAPARFVVSGVAHSSTSAEEEIVLLNVASSQVKLEEQKTKEKPPRYDEVEVLDKVTVEHRMRKWDELRAKRFDRKIDTGLSSLGW